RLVCDAAITWRHLAASCALPPAFPPVRIGGRFYCDGGLLSALPLWAAVEMGATAIVAVHALPRMPSRLLRGMARGFRALVRERHPAPSAPVTLIAPAAPLGTLGDAVRWRRETIERWIRQGQLDATAAFPQSPFAPGIASSPR
ncbi:MAG: patatin-like phospholipase family protein, partial [Bryobacteraceae bacterium]